jgi:hypothetical protein
MASSKEQRARSKEKKALAEIRKRRRAGKKLIADGIAKANRNGMCQS